MIGNFICGLFLLSAVTEAIDSHIPQRYDYRQSLKKPFYLNNDNKTIPYFDYFGDVLLSQDYLRLAPSLQNKAGSIWTQNSNPHKEWQVEFSFRVSGRGYSGGEGLAFWYTKERGIAGDIYGSKDAWTGLAVFFDTSDMHEERYVPYIYGVENDGSKHLSGRRDYLSVSMGGCFREYRNIPDPVWCRISYAEDSLRVEMDLRQHGKAYSTCFEHHALKLPAHYFFGLSAKSGQHLSDDHDLISFEVSELNPPKKVDKHQRPHEEEKLKKGESFHIDEKTKEHIQEVEHRVEEIRAAQESKTPKEEHLDIMNPQFLRSLQENQFHIMESLNQLHDKSGHSTVSFKERNSLSSTEMNQKFDEMYRHLDRLNQEIRALREFISEHPGIHDVSNQIRSLNGLCSSSLTASRQQAENSHEISKSLKQDWPLWTYLLIFFVAQISCMVGYGYWKKSKDDAKKFL